MVCGSLHQHIPEKAQLSHPIHRNLKWCSDESVPTHFRISTTYGCSPASPPLTFSDDSKPADESVRPLDGAGEPASSALAFFLRADLDSVEEEGGMLETAVDMVRSGCLISDLVEW